MKTFKCPKRGKEMKHSTYALAERAKEIQGLIERDKIKTERRKKS